MKYSQIALSKKSECANWKLCRLVEDREDFPLSTIPLSLFP